MESQQVYAATIIKSFNHVMDSFSSIKVASADIQISMKHETSCDITIHIGIFGDFEAKVYMSMDAITGMALASEMMGGMEMTEIDELVVSAVAEFCNMVMGNACTSLNRHEIKVDITPPLVVSDNITGICAAESSYKIVINLCNLGNIDFGVAWQKSI